jgi:hypothetical protein
MGLRSSGVVGRGHHLLPMVLLVLVPPVMASLGQDRVITAIASTEVIGAFSFATEVGLDHLLTGGVLGGDVQELPHRARGLTAERMDERLIGHATDEGVDDVGIDDVGGLIALLGKTLDVLIEGLIGPLPAVAKVLRVPGLSVLLILDTHMNEFKKDNPQVHGYQ